MIMYIIQFAIIYITHALTIYYILLYKYIKAFVKHIHLYFIAIAYMLYQINNKLCCVQIIPYTEIIMLNL